MQNGEIRVGVIGYGLAGSVFHAPLIAATPRMRVAAVVTGDADRASKARADHPGVEVARTPEALWEMAPSLELVVVASPNRTHVPLARAALERGLAVVVDKPLAVTAEEARALVEEAARRDLLLVPFQNRRWDGDFLTLRRLLAEGALGDVIRFESRFDRWRPNPKPGWRQQGAPEEGGGLLYDLGAHLIDQALLLFGPASEVYAEVDRRHPAAQVDDDTFVALRHASGVRSHLWMSTLSARPGPRLRVMGTRGAYVKLGLDPQEDTLRAGGRPGDAGWGREPEERWGLVGAEPELAPTPTEPGAYELFYAGVAAALLDGAPSPVPPADAVATLEIIEAAQRSARERRVVAT